MKLLEVSLRITWESFAPDKPLPPKTTRSTEHKGRKGHEKRVVPDGVGGDEMLFCGKKKDVCLGEKMVKEWTYYNSHIIQSYNMNQITVTMWYAMRSKEWYVDDDTCSHGWTNHTKILRCLCVILSTAETDYFGSRATSCPIVFLMSIRRANWIKRHILQRTSMDPPNLWKNMQMTTNINKLHIYTIEFTIIVNNQILDV